MYFQNYLTIFLFMIVAGGISIALLILPFLLGRRTHNRNKRLPYECGFDPEERHTKKFNVRFCLVAILFLIFDLEIAFLFPWAMAFRQLDLAGFLSMMFFLLILGVGFVYELKKGALDWS